MIIKKVKLTNFKRLALNNIYILEYTPTMSNLIMGTNGSGKTSLLREMNKMFGDKKDYRPDGSLEMEVEKDGHTYELKSMNGRHWFIKDGIELNDGHTGKVQQTLIAEHLKMNASIRNVISGDTLFTEMSPLERKEWFTMVSPVSFDYLVKTFTRAKSRVRDLEGALKLQNKKIFDIENDMDKDEYKRLKDESVFMEKYIQTLYTLSIKSEEVSLTDLTQLKQKVNKLKTISKQTYNLEPSIIQVKIDNLNKRIEDTLQQIDTLEDSKPKTVSVDIKKLSDKVSELEKLDFIKYNYEEMVSILKSPETSDLINLYTENYIEFTQEEVNELNASIDRYKTEVKNLNIKIISLDTEREFLIEAKKADNVKCPSCDTEFKPNFDSNKLSILEDTLKKYKEVVSKKSKILEAKESKLDAIRTIIDIKQKIHTTFKGNTNILDKLYSGNITYTFSYMANTADKLLLLPEYKASLNEAIITNRENEKTSHEYEANIISQINEENKKLQVLYKRRERHLKHFKRNSSIKANLDVFNRLTSDIRNDIENAKKQKDKYVSNIEYEFINNLINELQSYKSSIDVKLREYDFNNRSLVKLKEEVTELKNKITVGKIIVNGLSPNKGLIAKTVKGFIGNFIYKMNKVINEIWSYDMEIIPPTMSDNGDLSYRFPVKVNGELESHDGDVKGTSTGMADIINLAFVLVSKEYLDIEDYPLYLDEFAASFDAEHRRSAIDLISRLMDDKQVFMISHYNDVLYSIDDLDISILSTDNIEIANLKSYNENMMIL